MTYLDIITNLLYSDEYKNLSHTDMMNESQSLDTQMNFEQSVADIAAENLGCENHQDLIDLLIQLDYLTYVPFGQRGLNKANEYLEKNNEKENVTGYKINKITNVLKKNQIEVNQELTSKVKSFCHYLSNPNQDLSVPESLAAVVRILSGELDNLISAGKITGSAQKDKALKEMVMKLSDDANEKGTKINLDNYLQNKNTSKLTEKEIEYFENVTGLSVPPKTLNK